MNKAYLIGRLTSEPEVKYTNEKLAISRFTTAVDRKIKAEGQPEADFIRCTAFGKLGEFTEKYLHKGTKIALIGRIQTGSYTDKDNKKVYTTDVIAEEIEFCEKKSAETTTNKADGFVPMENIYDEELPFA